MSKASRRRRQQARGASAAPTSAPSASSQPESSDAPAEPRGSGAAAVTSKLTKTAKRKLQKKRAAEKRAVAVAAAARSDRAPHKKERSEISGESLAVLYEDLHVLVIHKPAGMLCHPSPGFWDSGTVVHALAARARTSGYSEIPAVMLEARQSYTGEADSFIPRAVVHRLDRGTTGLLVLAKTPHAETHLADAFKARRTKKRYVAILSGKPCLQPVPGVAVDHSRGVLHIDAPIDRDSARPGKMQVATGGKAAQSIVHLHATCEGAGLSLVTVELHTGRTHQIRVHCAHLGAPLLNDEAYGLADAVKAARTRWGPLARGRPLLHAWHMEVAHPDQEVQQPLVVDAPLPLDMVNIISQVWPTLRADPSTWPALQLSA